MLRSNGASRTWPPVTVSTLVLNVVAVGMLSLTLLTWQPDNSPRWLLWTLWSVAVGGLAWTLVRGRALGRLDVAVVGALAYGAMAALTWGTDRQLAVLYNGTGTPTLAVYVVWFLPLSWARLVSYAGTALWCLAVQSHDDAVFALPTLTVVLQVVAATEVLGRLRDQLLQMARTDQLTGALNRWGVHGAVADALARLRRAGTPSTVLLLDLDDLRAVNSSGGHAAGDALLVRVVEHLRSRLRPGDALGRLGGDEFVVVLPGSGGAAGEEVARRLAEQAPASWSVGVAEARSDDDPASVLDRADRRMYADKQARRRAQT